MYMGYLPSVTNREDWQLRLQLVDADTDEVINIQDATITMSVYPCQSRRWLTLRGSTSSGEITIDSDNSFQWLFLDSQMASLAQGQYEVGMRILLDDRRTQLFVASIEIYEGLDTQ